LTTSVAVLHAAIMIGPLIAALVAGVLTLLLLRAAAARRRQDRRDAARATAMAARRSAEIEAAAIRRSAQTAAREQALLLRTRADEEHSRTAEARALRERHLVSREAELDEDAGGIEERAELLDERHKAVQSLRDRAQGLHRDAEERMQRARQDLETKAGDTAEGVKDALVQGWIEEVRAEAAHALRTVEQSSADPKYDRDARRIMDIAVSRYQNHFLTERNISNLRVGGEVCELLVASGGALHEALQEVANVQLHINMDEEMVRLEGLDGVGREVARRALSRLMKKPSAQIDAQAEPTAWARAIRETLEREIVSLGRKAFNVLKIPRSHPDIVALVGALNYRTSYTQNQWLHAVEASFLAGIMASEMGLDMKLARRATLMHDIGKALTHTIDGSHAVIGADIARKLGEDEIVANAIGAHHADEPPNSLYAYLVAAADAMSGARQGARREATEGFSNRVEDLERIGSEYKGVDRAHAVHGGRELRVYVDEARVDDLNVVELSAEIAERISEEMTFPGQIKITVIRSFEAVSVAN
jgi:ribonucrease Y